MNKSIFISIVCVAMIAGCDLFKPPEPPKKPPWGKWLPPDADYSERRLRVKFGDVWYEIPVSYLINESWGDLDIVSDPKRNNGVIIRASYPDLVPQHKMQAHGIPLYPNIEVILGGHKDDPRTAQISASFNKSAQDKSEFDSTVNHSINHSCGKPEVSNLAKGMLKYTCGGNPHFFYYFTPIDSALVTPAGYKLAIYCLNAIPLARSGIRSKYSCHIRSRMFNDDRYISTRLYINDFSSIPDVYHKTLQLLATLEAPNQQGE